MSFFSIRAKGLKWLVSQVLEILGVVSVGVLGLLICIEKRGGPKEEGTFSLLDVEIECLEETNLLDVAEYILTFIPGCNFFCGDSVLWGLFE